MQIFSGVPICRCGKIMDITAIGEPGSYKSRIMAIRHCSALKVFALSASRFAFECANPGDVLGNHRVRVN